MRSSQPKRSIPGGRAEAKPPTAAVKKVPDAEVSKRRIKPGLVSAVLLIAIVAIALFFRVYLPYGNVFTEEGIRYTSNDSYFFMRLVDNLVHNFPHYTQIDPYHIYPTLSGKITINFFVWLIAIPAWIAGLGSPSQHTIDVIGVFMPAILGALTVIPVYFIGKELFNRWAGILAAALIAMLPGEFLGRSILGFTDTNIVEAPLTTVAILFLILAIKTAKNRQLSLSHLKQRDWATIRKPLIYSLLAALFLGLYMFAWLGALLFVFITFLYFVIQFIIDHLKHKSTDYLCIVGVVFFLVALLFALTISSSMLYIASLVIATLAMPVLTVISRWMENKRLMPVFYPLTLLGLGVVGGAFIFLINRSLFTLMLEAFSIFRPTGAQLTTVEMQPFFSSLYGNPLLIAWGNFPGLLRPVTSAPAGWNLANIAPMISSTLFFSVVAIFIVAVVAIKSSNSEKILLIVWSLVILAATIGQRRFGYYLAVNVAVLTGYLWWKILQLTGLRWIASLKAESARGASIRKGTKRRFPITANHVVTGLAFLVSFIIIFFGVYFGNIETAVAVAKSAPYAPSHRWVTSLNWLKENSPEPFGDPDAYYRVEEALRPGEYYQFPESAYGVLAWWDYGYWITRISHRIPNANPSQDPEALNNVASFFISQDEASANEIREKLGSAYVVVDHETSLSKLWAVITWAGRQPEEYFDRESYLVPQQDGSLRGPVTLFYPEYYRTMAVRLFNFDGQAVTPESVMVISYDEKEDKNGRVYKIITSAEPFASYEEAEAFMASKTTGNYRIVGTSPMKSIAPLEALERYELVHSSNSTVTVQDGTTVPQVKIFQFKE